MVTGGPRPLPYAWDRVREALQDRILQLVSDLGIREQPDRNGLIHPLNPNRDDRKPGSFVIWTRGDSGVGAWKDYACGDKGDVFDLIQYLAKPRPASKIDVYWWALNWLGWERHEVRSQAEDAAARERRERERRAFEARRAAAEADMSRRLFGLWLGLPAIRDTPAWRYLCEARNLPMDRLAHPPGALRWAREVDWIDPETGEVFTWRNVMVSAMTRGKVVTGLHRTFLAPDGSGPDPVKKAQGKHKTMIGHPSGAAIRLSPGPSGLSPTKAAAAGRRDPLIICEGIEDGLTLALARPDCRVWAAGSLSLMGLIDWPECAAAVVLAADNDWEKPEAVRAFERVEAHWRQQAQGRPVHVVRSRAGKDFNDWAMASA